MDDAALRPVALCIGASRGIGRSIAVALARSGYDLALGARTVEAGEVHSHGLAGGPSALSGSLQETAELVREAAAGDCKVLLVRMDLLQQDSCVAAVEETKAKLGRLDVVVNAAVYKGPGDLRRVADLDVRDYHDMVQCNQVTPLAVFKRALEGFQEQGSGTLVQVSTSSIHLVPRNPVDKGGWDFGYVSTKAALSKLMALLALEHPLGSSGLRFFNVEPGLVVTEIMKQRGLDGAYAAGFGDVPPDVCGQVVAYLCASGTDQVAKYNGRSVYAPKLCEELGLIEGYKERKPKDGVSKL